MKLSQIEFRNHPILKNLKISFTKSTGETYSNIIFVGENGCGKTTILNELFNYRNSKYIINKMQILNDGDNSHFKCLYVAQDIKFRNAINSVNKAIGGSIFYKDLIESDNSSNSNSANATSIKKNNIVNDKSMLVKRLTDFYNERVASFLLNSDSPLMDDISKQVLINGNGISPKVDTFSSGEQELILRLETLKSRIFSDLDILIIDEPETSLHPKWQLKIVPFIVDILKDNKTGKRDLQLFIASHSENVLKSIFDRSDTLIVRLYKDNDTIKGQNITAMDTVLNKTTIAEIQYLVFGIISSEYHNQLYGKFLSMCGRTQADVSRYLQKKYGEKYETLLNPYGYIFNNEIENLPTYIRNATDHPENTDRHYTEKDLTKSIELLRKEIEGYTK